jgi:hypothetical protein
MSQKINPEAICGADGRRAVFARLSPIMHERRRKMEFEKISLSNNDCKSKENLYGIILAGVGQREVATAEPAGSEPDQLDPYAKFIDGQSLLELTLRRVKKAISPKRVFVLVNGNHLAVDETRGKSPIAGTIPFCGNPDARIPCRVSSWH